MPGQQKQFMDLELGPTWVPNASGEGTDLYIMFHYPLQTTCTLHCIIFMFSYVLAQYLLHGAVSERVCLQEWIPMATELILIAHLHSIATL